MVRLHWAANNPATNPTRFTTRCFAPRLKYVLGNLVGVGLTEINPKSGNVAAELFDVLIATWSLTLTGAIRRRTSHGMHGLTCRPVWRPGTVIGIIGGLAAVSDLATFGDEIPLAHKFLKHKVEHGHYRNSGRASSSTAGNSEVEMETGEQTDGDVALANDGVESSELEERVVSMESKLDALTANSSKLADSMDELRADMRRLLMLQQLADIMDRGPAMSDPPLPPPPGTQPPPETVARRRRATASELGRTANSQIGQSQPDDPHNRRAKAYEEPGEPQVIMTSVSI